MTCTEWLEARGKSMEYPAGTSSEDRSNSAMLRLRATRGMRGS
jgi:hypothetical protein